MSPCHSLDACDVNNGGCHINALCSHEAKTNRVVCKCKTGYVDTDPGLLVVCTGKNTMALTLIFIDVVDRCLPSEEWRL